MSKGLTIFFTGLSGSGKTTLAHALMEKLISQGKQNTTVLDGDVFRQTMCKDLGFSKADRNQNILRMGFVAAEITKVGGIALCAAIAPYAESRNENRRLISQFGHYVEIYVSTPLLVCERRDPKGLYAQVRAGKLQRFTGIDDPYEAPENAEMTIDTSTSRLEQSVTHIMNFLTDEIFKEKIKKPYLVLEEVM